MSGTTRHDWFKSSYSKESADCVEVCFADRAVFVRDSKYAGNPAAQPILAIPATAWDAFTAGLR